MSLAVRSVGTFSASATTPTPGAPSGQLTGDIILIVSEFMKTDDNDTTAGTTPSGYTPLFHDAHGVGVHMAVSHLAIYGKIATGDAESMPTITDEGDHTTAVALAIQDHGCAAIGNVQVGTAGKGSFATPSGTATIPAIVTAQADTLVLAVCSNGNNQTSTTAFDAWTNANLASLTEIQDNTNTAGGGGGTGIASGTKATAASTGDTTVTVATADPAQYWIGVHLGIKPVSAATTAWTVGLSI